MIDSLVRLLPETEGRSIWHDYALVTLHRPSNVDDPEVLRRLAEALKEMSRLIPVVFPVHPRTRVRLEAMSDVCRTENLRLLEPAGYVEFLELQSHARFVVTDSGGIQEETTYLGIPCLTLRENTERPITVEVGSNILIGQDVERLHHEVAQILAGNARRGTNAAALGRSRCRAHRPGRRTMAGACSAVACATGVDERCWPSPVHASGPFLAHRTAGGKRGIMSQGQLVVRRGVLVPTSGPDRLSATGIRGLSAADPESPDILARCAGREPGPAAGPARSLLHDFLRQVRLRRTVRPQRHTHARLSGTDRPPV